MSATTGFNPISMGDVENCMNSCADAFAQLAAYLESLPR